MNDDAARFLRVTDGLLILASQTATLVKRIDGVARVSQRGRKRELESIAKRLVERRTKATEMAEAEVEHEFETLYHRLVASMEGLRELVAHANRVLNGMIGKG